MNVLLILDFCSNLDLNSNRSSKDSRASPRATSRVDGRLLQGSNYHSDSSEDEPLSEKQKRKDKDKDKMRERDRFKKGIENNL